MPRQWALGSNESVARGAGGGGGGNSCGVRVEFWVRGCVTATALKRGGAILFCCLCPQVRGTGKKVCVGGGGDPRSPGTKVPVAPGGGVGGGGGIP